MAPESLEYPERVNLDNCATEPIHQIGKTQAYGVIVVCDPKDFRVVQIGENAEQILGLSYDKILEKNFSEFLSNEDFENLKASINSKETSDAFEVNILGKKINISAHFSEGSLILDLEPIKVVQDPFIFQRQLANILNRFHEADSVEQLSEVAVSFTKSMFGYDRVMIYRFDEQWNGEVFAEAKENEMESWLGLHYPATDIPEQSRRLFLKHRVRIISDVAYRPILIIPELSPLTGNPLDISRSALRAVSPIHIEYLENMEVGASLSAAIIVKGKLWGLIACHHKTAKYLDFYQRESARFLAQMFSTELALRETSETLNRSELSDNIRRQLVNQLNYHKDIVQALCHDTVKFTDLIACGGGALYVKGRWKLYGKTPSREQLQSLLFNYIKPHPKNLVMERNMSALFPEAAAFKDTASGILSLKIADNKYFFWFRPEEVQVVNWGGNPEEKAFYNPKEQRLSPRKSFEKWSQELTGVSQPWNVLDRNIARAFRENVSHFVLARQREEIEALNEKLTEANQELELFSYGLSHDLRAPIRGMEGFLTILEEDHSEELSAEGRKLVTMARGLTEKMNLLIDNILEYSRLSHIHGQDFQEINTSELIKEVLELFNIEASYPRTTLKIQNDLPHLKGDRRMIFQLWANLLSNAYKYSAENDAPIVEVGIVNRKGKNVFFVKDNGIGINPGFKEKIFKTFTRAVGSRFKGSGIGLAIVKKIVEKHGGEVWVESEPEKGSEFYFYLDPLN